MRKKSHPDEEREERTGRQSPPRRPAATKDFLNPCKKRHLQRRAEDELQPGGDANRKGRYRKIKEETSSDSSSGVRYRSPFKKRRTPHASPIRKSPPVMDMYPAPEVCRGDRSDYISSEIQEEKCIPLFVTSPSNLKPKGQIVIPVCCRKTGTTQDVGTNKTKISPSTRQYVDEASTQFPSVAERKATSVSNQVPEVYVEQQQQAPSAHDAVIATSPSKPPAPPPKEVQDFDTPTAPGTTDYTDFTDYKEPLRDDKPYYKDAKFALDACQLIRRLASLEERERRRKDLPDVNDSDPFIHLPCKPCFEAAKRHFEKMPDSMYVSSSSVPQTQTIPDGQGRLIKSSLSKQPRYSEPLQTQVPWSPAQQSQAQTSQGQITQAPTTQVQMNQGQMSQGQWGQVQPTQIGQSVQKIVTPSVIPESQGSNYDTCVIFEPVHCPNLSRPIVKLSPPVKTPVTAEPVQILVPVEAGTPIATQPPAPLPIAYSSDARSDTTQPRPTQPPALPIGYPALPMGYPMDARYDTATSASKSSQPSQFSQQVRQQPQPSAPPEVTPEPRKVQVHDSLEELQMRKPPFKFKVIPNKLACCTMPKRSSCSRDRSPNREKSPPLRSKKLRAENILGLAEVTHGTKIWRMLLAEFLGTLLLVYIGCGSTMVFDKSPTTVEIAFTFGLLAATIIQSIFHVSGGHINPAVSISFFVVCKMKLIRTVLYIVSQLLGAAAGAALLMASTPNEYEGDLGVTTVAHVEPEQAFLYEIILTFMVCIMIHGFADSRRKDIKGSAPLAIGLAVAAAHLSGFKYSKSSMNPARSFGPALITNTWTDHWIYWAGPIIGACLAAVTYRFLFRVRKSEDESYDF